jgi:hypothetical protein
MKFAAYIQSYCTHATSSKPAGTPGTDTPIRNRYFESARAHCLPTRGHIRNPIRTLVPAVHTADRLDLAEYQRDNKISRPGVL